MPSDRAKSSWSRRRTAVYWVFVIAIWVASMALANAVDVQDRGAAAVLVAAGMVVFVVLFAVFVVRSLKVR
jgi:hypothetical protein